MLWMKEEHVKVILAVLCLVMLAATPGEVGRQALLEVNWDWRPADWTIEFEPGIETWVGSAYFEEKRIIIWVRPGYSAKRVAATVVHELAHVFARMYLTRSLRQEWMNTRKLPPGTPWEPLTAYEDDFSSGVGDFVESVAWTLQGYSFNGRLKSTPNKRERALIKKWLEELPKGRP